MCVRNIIFHSAFQRSEECPVSLTMFANPRPYRDAQDSLLWRDKTCPACTQLSMSCKAIQLLFVSLLLSLLLLYIIIVIIIIIICFYYYIYYYYVFCLLQECRQLLQWCLPDGQGEQQPDADRGDGCKPQGHLQPALCRHRQHIQVRRQLHAALSKCDSSWQSR